MKKGQMALDYLLIAIAIAGQNICNATDELPAKITRYKEISDHPEFAGEKHQLVNVLNQWWVRVVTELKTTEKIIELMETIIPMTSANLARTDITKRVLDVLGDDRWLNENLDQLNDIISELSGRRGRPVLYGVHDPAILRDPDNDWRRKDEANSKK